MPRIPVKDLHEGMIVYYAFDSDDSGDWSDVAEINTASVVITWKGKPMLLGLRDGDGSAGVYQPGLRDPEDWHPYTSQKEATLSSLRDALIRHQKHARDIQKVIAVLEGTPSDG